MPGPGGLPPSGQPCRGGICGTRQPPPRPCEGVTAGAPVLPQLMGMAPRLSPAMIALPLPPALLLPVEDGSPPRCASHRHSTPSSTARAQAWETRLACNSQRSAAAVATSSCRRGSLPVASCVGSAAAAVAAKARRRKSGSSPGTASMRGQQLPPPLAAAAGDGMPARVVVCSYPGRPPAAQQAASHSGAVCVGCCSVVTEHRRHRACISPLDRPRRIPRGTDYLPRSFFWSNGDILRNNTPPRNVPA
eukprot:COSAG01_NODE_10308_length_2194_cov_3.406295_2_plen_248_part_00